jgi:hypothetical protein
MTTAQVELNDVAKALIDGTLTAFKSNKGWADKARPAGASRIRVHLPRHALPDREPAGADRTDSRRCQCSSQQPGF